MSFYYYPQNNSGGIFKGKYRAYIIEADNSIEADDIAEGLGVYFDGVESDIDCECCGDRWYRANEPHSLIGVKITNEVLVVYKDNNKIKGGV